MRGARGGHQEGAAGDPLPGCGPMPSTGGARIPWQHTFLGFQLVAWSPPFASSRWGSRSLAPLGNGTTQGRWPLPGSPAASVLPVLGRRAAPRAGCLWIHRAPGPLKGLLTYLLQEILHRFQNSKDKRKIRSRTSLLSRAPAAHHPQRPRRRLGVGYLFRISSCKHKHIRILPPSPL